MKRVQRSPKGRLCCYPTSFTPKYSNDTFFMFRIYVRSIT